MTTRYIFNTSGDYVAFIRGNHLFSKDCEWLGTIANGNEVFNTDGLHVGYLLDDDRIVRNKSESTSKRIPRQVKPIRPVRPVTPLRRLRKSKLPPPFEDVFDYSKVGKLLTNRNFPSFDHLLGAQIIANDGTLLGIINTNRYDPNSISNPYGQGNRYKSTSILNPYGRYGGKSSNQSPFNQYTSTPPKIVATNQVIGHLTKNKYVPNPLDPDELLAWLKIEV